ncbi:hypothetical protein [Streptomyces sp. NBC_00829]|uniref:hypothetical protein n=1 Tax=Streptomyces sp. NBC_00829 TaxID=2903679 RepID=UPI003867D1A2|nr:hypothetical protein OG293_20275 [Streptomyces sp. NBC_00829]
MAYLNSSCALPTPAHPMASPGYGKRLASDESPGRRGDFAHLPKREASVAAFIDRLPEGAAMDHKTLAKHIADYGQAAIRSALKALTNAGHLRRIKEKVVRDDGTRWVTRTYWSRTARSAEWWQEFCRSVRGVMLDALDDAPDGTHDDEPAAEPAPERTTAYRTLAALGRTDSRMTLSAADCERLEPLAATWLTYGASVTHLIRALTDGLPDAVHSPAGIAKRRLEDKMPPKPYREPETVLHTVMVCMFCDTTEEDEPLINGMCEACRSEDEDDIPATFRPGPRPADVAAHADAARIAAGLPPRSRG